MTSITANSTQKTNSTQPKRQFNLISLPRDLIVFLSSIAESEGFEPPERCKRSTVFKTAAIDRSANSPKRNPSRASRMVTG